MMHFERRNSKRVNARIPVRYNFESKTKEENRSESLLRNLKQSGIAANISKSGLLFLSYENIDSRDPLKMNITLPLKQKNERINVMAKIKWVRPKSEQTFNEDIFKLFSYCCGVEFIPSQEETKLSEFVDFWTTLSK